jgi:predicted phage terminase large subunit-like protein
MNGTRTIFDNSASLASATATPGLFARHVSHGQWVLAPHLKMIDRRVTAMLTKRTDRRRLMIFTPPRHGKSLYTGVYTPAWCNCRYPDRRVIVASGSSDLVERHASMSRDIIDEVGERCFNVRLDPRHRSKTNFRIEGHHGGLYSTTVGGQLTGMGADVLIIDDPVKNAEEALSPTYRRRNWDWWQSTASTRLEPDAVVILMNTRWHAEDLSGMLLREEPDRWDVLCLPAIAEDNDILKRSPGEALWPERYPIEVLREIERDKTAYWFGAMYQQHPGQYGEDSWPEAYFDNIFATMGEWPKSFRLSAMFIDPALGRDKKKGDYSAMAFVGLADGKAWIDCWLGRVPPPELLRQMVRFWTLHKPGVLKCETNGFQQLLADQWRQVADESGLIGVECYPHENQGDKVTRIEGMLTPLLSRGLIRVNDTPHGRMFVQQARAIPNGDHDDGPDAAASALRVAQEFGAGQIRDCFGRSIYERSMN